MRNDNGWLYLPVEVKVRELDAKMLLAYYAAKESYRVIIGEHRMVELASAKYPKGFFFSKGYPRSFRKRIITNANNHGHTIVELDEEGLLLSNPSHYLRDRMQSDMLDLVTQEYCWGDVQKKTITRSYPEYANKCHIVGNPRFDLLMPKFRILYQKDAETIKNNYGKFVLINTRFSLYNSLTGMNKNIHDSIYFKKLYESFLEMTKTLCKKFPDFNFIIRPHPGENLESYRTALASYNNIHVIHEGNIIKWLMAAEAIIHNGCTSSIEAFLIEKPVISYVPITSAGYDVDLPNQLGMKASTIKEVNQILEKLLHSSILSNSVYQKQINEGKKILRQYYNWPTKKFSYETILHLLKSIPLPSTNHSPPKEMLYKKENKYVKYFFPSLYKEEIQRFFHKMDSIENENNQFSIHQIGINLFEIHR